MLIYLWLLPLTLPKLAVIVTTIERCRSFIYFSAHFISVRMPWWQVGPSFENEAAMILRVASHKWHGRQPIADADQQEVRQLLAHKDEEALT